MPNYVKALDVLRNFSIRGIGASVSIIYVGHMENVKCHRH